jgi:acetyl esterase/lipase
MASLLAPVRTGKLSPTKAPSENSLLPALFATAEFDMPQDERGHLAAEFKQHGIEVILARLEGCIMHLCCLMPRLMY